MEDKEEKADFIKVSNHLIIDATNATLGRLASYAAKQALQGKTVDIVNCNQAIILGNPEYTLKRYQKLVRRGSSSLLGPFFPKTPEKLLKRAVRGMLPDHRVGRGKAALGMVKCHNLVPAEFKESHKILAGKVKTARKMTLKELYQKL